MKNKMMTKAATALTKFSAKAKKHSPEILLVAGIAGAVGTVILACVGTRKLDTVLDESKERIDEIHNTCVCEGAPDDKKEQQKELVKAYVQTGLDFAKLYGA